ncbi:MAG: hypothetical protein VX638_03390 [Chloroflexota bacterium]|nr:hypothetical protein [Chloroflexota bacterium]
MSDATCLPTTTWFLYLEDDMPLGRVYRSSDPRAEAQIEDGPGFASAEVVSCTELRATCAMRRFKVIVRILT